MSENISQIPATAELNLGGSVDQNQSYAQVQAEQKAQAEQAQAEGAVVVETVAAGETPAVVFADLGLPEPLNQAIADLGYVNPTPIQVKSIPYLLEGRDLLGLAQTGSGKTASFMLPILSRIDSEQRGIQVLVLSPTRELALQVATATNSFTKYLPNIRTLAIYGGQPYGAQLSQIRRGVQVVVATPGRLQDLLDHGQIDFSNLKAVVLDEADEMLSMGFADALEDILSRVPPTAQMALFSATMKDSVESITKKYLKTPHVVKIEKSKGNEPKIDQFYWIANNAYNKNEGLVRFLESETYAAVIIFVKTKQGCNEVCEALLKNNVAAACLHGDMSQDVRNTTLKAFQTQSLSVLVATDVAARGLDIEHIDLVINFDLPTDTDTYVHRVGRTGRAGREGRAISFVEPKERAMLYNIEKALGKELNEILAPRNRDLEKLRRAAFKRDLEAKLNDNDLEMYQELVEQLIPTDYDHDQVLAALVNLATSHRRLVLPAERDFKDRIYYNRGYFERGNDRRNNSRPVGLFQVNLGRAHRLRIEDLIRLIAQHIPKQMQIGKISIGQETTTVELPLDISPAVIAKLAKAQLEGRALEIKQIPGYRGQNRQGGRGQGGFRGGNRSGGFQRRDGEGYQRREGSYQRRDGEGYQRREGGYQRRDGEGYQRREGGYQRRDGEGYQRREGGFQRRERNGGYNRRHEG